MHVEHMLSLSDLPRDCIETCSAPGPADEAVDYWHDELGFTVDRKRAERCLQGYGAWDDLDAASDETLAKRVLWLACGDFSEFITYAEREGFDPHNPPEGFDPPAGSDIFVLE